MELGDKIKMLREQKDMTLEELGNAVGVGKSTVRKWENGMIANMRRDKIAKVAAALDVSPAYLMGWKEEPKENPALLELAKQMDPALRALQDKIGKLTIENRISVEIFVDALLAKQDKEKGAGSAG